MKRPRYLVMHPTAGWSAADRLSFGLLWSMMEADPQAYEGWVFVVLDWPPAAP